MTLNLEVIVVISVPNPPTEKLIIRLCHLCGTLNEGDSEPKKCSKCEKSFLPLNYFQKLHQVSDESFNELFSHGNEISEEELIIGLYVVW